MAPLVSQLDDETLEQIAAFYAAQPGLFQTPR
jgi:cytochrome c553